MKSITHHSTKGRSCSSDLARFFARSAPVENEISYEIFFITAHHSEIDIKPRLMMPSLLLFLAMIVKYTKKKCKYFKYIACAEKNPLAFILPHIIQSPPNFRELSLQRL